MTETQLVSSLKKWLNSLENSVFYKIHGSQFMENGIPDLVGTYNGIFVGIETKVKKGKTSPVQDYQIKRLRNAGASIFVINEVNVNDFKENLEEYIYGKKLWTWN